MAERWWVVSEGLIQVVNDLRDQNTRAMKTIADLVEQTGEYQTHSNRCHARIKELEGELLSANGGWQQYKQAFENEFANHKSTTSSLVQAHAALKVSLEALMRWSEVSSEDANNQAFAAISTIKACGVTNE
jgi:hypothetical protein